MDNVETTVVVGGSEDRLPESVGSGISEDINHQI